MRGARGIGLLWGAVAAALVAAAPIAPSFLPHLPGCLFKQMFGLPCPTCGGTRAALALTRIELGDAFRSNPLVTLTVLALVVGGLLAGMLALGGRPLEEPKRYPIWLRAAAILAIASNWAWLWMDGR